ncbi:hypothetical protein [Gemmiger formicilis]|uniref:hypothetical protein n=1 Tax=Gemmiger formicilis TaxID=745368 RepID=UPI003CCADB11
MAKMIADRPWLWATHVWNMFDFAADGRDEGGKNGENQKGLVTFDRKIKKDAFYLYKAYWSKQPFVHTCGSRYVDRTEDVTEVRYTPTCRRFRCTWTDTWSKQKRRQSVCFQCAHHRQAQH